MRIACPACNATYSVPDDQLSEGRVVRCARCGTDWAPVEVVPPSEAEPALPPEPEPEPVIEAVPLSTEPPIETARMAVVEEVLPPPALPKPAAKARVPVSLVVAWVLSVGVVAGAVAGLYAGRERVMAAWPPSVRAYAAVGLAGRAPAPAQVSERRE